MSDPVTTTNLITETTTLVVATPPPAEKRLPRFKRAPREVDFVLTTRDLEILKTVKSFRLMTSAHIQALADGSNQGVLRRLQKLFHAGYLDRLSPRPRYGEGSSKMVYAITNKGIRYLQKEGVIAEASQTDWNFQNRTLHEFSIAHTLLISHIRAVLTAACRLHPDLEILFWREGPSTQDAIEVALPERYQRVPIAPDAFFGIQDPKGRMYFFLEADRGTMTVKRFHLKLQAYAAYWQEKKQQEKFGIKNFRVLTVTTSPVRQSNLVAAAAADHEVSKLSRMFLFTDESRLPLADPEQVFGSIWHPMVGRNRSALLS
jgi:hypothetical protein